MLQKLIAFRDNILLFSLGCYGLGLIYLSLYYYAFDVPIIYYLSLNDMLLLAVTLIIPVVFVVFITEFFVVEVLKVLIVRFYLKRDFEGRESATFYLCCVTFLSSLMIIAAFFKTVQTNPSLYFFLLFSSMLVIAKISSNIDRGNFIFPIITGFAGFLLGIHSLVNHAKSGLANKEVKFMYNEKVISTRYYSSLNYVGETSSTIFLFDLESKVTSVYEKEKISNLQYLDKIKSQDWQKSKIQYFELKDAKTSTKQDSTKAPYQWYTSNKKDFNWVAEKSSLGIGRIMIQLKNILRANQLDFEIPAEDYSTLPNNLNLVPDCKNVHDAIANGEYVVNKWWAHPSGYINFRLEKDLYIIEIKYQRVRNLEKTRDLY